MQEGRRVSVIKEEPGGTRVEERWVEERGIEMRSSVWPDHVCLQHIGRCLMSVKDVDS